MRWPLDWIFAATLHERASLWAVSSSFSPCPAAFRFSWSSRRLWASGSCSFRCPSSSSGRRRPCLPRPLGARGPFGRRLWRNLARGHAGPIWLRRIEDREPRPPSVGADPAPPRPAYAGLCAGCCVQRVVQQFPLCRGRTSVPGIASVHRVGGVFCNATRPCLSVLGSILAIGLRSRRCLLAGATLVSQVRHPGSWL